MSEDDDRDRSDESNRQQDGQSDQQSGQSDEGPSTSTVEKAVMAVSIGFTIILFAYAGYQLFTPAQADAPQASIVGTEPLANGSVAVTVQLRNPTAVGLVSATVESSCTSPPPDVQFSYVPASSTRTATLVCPAESSNASVSVTSWVGE